MKDKGAEDLLRGKIRAEESAGGLLDNNDALWSALSERLDEKKTVPRRRLYLYWAAASVLLMLALWLYPAQRKDPVQQAARVQPAAADHKLLPEKQKIQQTPAQAVHPTAQEIAAQVNKKAPLRKQKTKVQQEEKSDAEENAGLYAMPQIACAEIPAGNYPLCSQTL